MSGLEFLVAFSSITFLAWKASLPTYTHKNNEASVQSDKSDKEKIDLRGPEYYSMSYLSKIVFPGI
jgi:hypothetical protein